MKARLIFLTAILYLFGFQVEAQILKKLQKKVERTVERKLEQKVEKQTEKTMDTILNGKNEKKDNPNSENGHDAEEANEDDTNSVQSDTVNNSVPSDSITSFGTYTNFTFEPGNKILFFDDFSKDKLGDFPVNWETNGSGEVVTNSVYGGNWLSLSARSGYLPSTNELPENYTLEFDMATNGFGGIGTSAAISIVFIYKKSYSIGASGGHALLRIGLSESGTIRLANTGAEKTPRIATSLRHKFKLDTHVHFSVSVNKKRLRIWMEEEKIVDNPNFLVGNMGRYILFEAYNILPEKNQTFLISNVKIAESKEDLRSQLLDKGRFSTTGIYFNTDKADIKPESYAVLKSVADYLKENPDVKIQIIGHTDAQGEDEYNRQLSEKRAQSVIKALVQQFKIAETRMSATGKGESEPVAENTTPEGKANNRRVEFVKV